MIPRDRFEQKHDSAEPLLEGVDTSWVQTKDRFLWKLVDVYYFKSAGMAVDPEMALTTVRNSMEEDLYRSVSDFFLPWSRPSIQQAFYCGGSHSRPGPPQQRRKKGNPGSVNNF